MSRVERAFDRATSALYRGSAVALLLILVLMLVRVVSRNLSLGISGLQIVAQAAAVWLTFMIVGALEWERRHIEIDYFTDRIPERWQPLHEIFVTLVGTYAAYVIFVGSAIAMVTFADSTSPAVDIPIPFYYAASTLGAGFLLSIYGYRIYSAVQEVRR
ncbi:TRAP transporter small permease [Halolamina sp. C58]|uniref:TRAP transporter small permease n=1 Tax=Halolamina sp. C58 TaxID=3421640 RepID=UPI003EBC0822